jgi:hypothetical protein
MPEFRFRIVRLFADCLSRQVAESVRIDLREEVLNSKTMSIVETVYQGLSWRKQNGKRKMRKGRNVTKNGRKIRRNSKRKWEKAEIKNV